jgi:hypothetical protein
MGVSVIASAGRRTIFDRMLGAALLEPEIYEEAALVSSVWTQAALIVVITSMAAGIANLGGGLTGFVLGFLGALLGWGLCVFASYWTATKKFGVLRTETALSATVRGLGLASTPRIFLLLTFIPTVGLLIGLAVHAWTLITMTFAIKPALDLETRPAILVALAGCLPMLLVWALAVIVV